jgi:hypothetical protein
LAQDKGLSSPYIEGGRKTIVRKEALGSLLRAIRSAKGSSGDGGRTGQSGDLLSRPDFIANRAPPACNERAPYSQTAPGDTENGQVQHMDGFPRTPEGELEKTLYLAVFWSTSVRAALKRGCAPEEVKRAAGVGARFSNACAEGALTSVCAVLDAYGRFPEAFRGSGLLPEDMQDGKALAFALSATRPARENPWGRKVGPVGADRAG